MLLLFVLSDQAVVVPLLRFAYESECIPGPARLEAEQPADEFVYERNKCLMTWTAISRGQITVSQRISLSELSC